VTVDLETICSNARRASAEVATLPSSAKDHILTELKNALDRSRKLVIAANRMDVQEAEAEQANPAVIDRLKLSDKHIDGMLAGVEAIQGISDPVGRELRSWTMPSGIAISKVSVPIGIIGIVYEGRPNVTIDAASLCLKSGNSAVLKGSRHALHSNRALVGAIRHALMACNVSPTAVQLWEAIDRSSLDEFLQLRGKLDAIIPRGGKELIDLVSRRATVPVIETGAGVCHVYLHEDAQYAMAERIILNSKTQRPTVCNALDTMLVHEKWAKAHLVQLVGKLRDSHVDCLGCDRSRELIGTIGTATEEDWSTEFLSLRMAIRVVSDLEHAIDHISTYGTKHSDAIVTSDDNTAATFLNKVDSAVVYHNCSTRFTDGFEFGFGGEIGISTQKLHARGPMGVEELTTYKYVVRGDGVVRK